MPLGRELDRQGETDLAEGHYADTHGQLPPMGVPGPSFNEHGRGAATPHRDRSLRGIP